MPLLQFLIDDLLEFWKVERTIVLAAIHEHGRGAFDAGFIAILHVSEHSLSGLDGFDIGLKALNVQTRITGNGQHSGP